MAPVYSTLLLAASPGGGATFTVPAGYVAVVVDVEWASNDVDGSYLSLNDGADVVVFSSAIPNPLTGVPSGQWVGRQVVEPGDTVSVVSDATSLSIRVTGYLLTLP